MLSEHHSLLAHTYDGLTVLKKSFATYIQLLLLWGDVRKTSVLPIKNVIARKREIKIFEWSFIASSTLVTKNLLFLIYHWLIYRDQRSVENEKYDTYNKQDYTEMMETNFAERLPCFSFVKAAPLDHVKSETSLLLIYLIAKSSTETFPHFKGRRTLKVDYFLYHNPFSELSSLVAAWLPQNISVTIYIPVIPAKNIKHWKCPSIACFLII